MNVQDIAITLSVRDWSLLIHVLDAFADRIKRDRCVPPSLCSCAEIEDYADTLSKRLFEFSGRVVSGRSLSDCPCAELIAASCERGERYAGCPLRVDTSVVRFDPARVKAGRRWPKAR